MNADEHLQNLMRHIDGEAETRLDPTSMAEVKELKAKVEALKDLPMHMPDSATDHKIAAFLEAKEQEEASPLKINQWLPYVFAAASLAILVYVFLPEKSGQRYELIESNPDRISFIHQLNEEELSREDLLWLVSLLEHEEHPNIRVTILDLIESQGEDLPLELAQNLVREEVPAVQMAFLNTLDQKYEPEMKDPLMAFNGREDLDPMVRKRIEDILINK
ncbi:MAG: hypothetical protein KJP14_02870 [Eudoraea sp.]|nr:hypothetical protein [Eudoraea sp.]MBT8209446.1 hypothetical protein [Eudoraea sp.]NNK29548.1 hypothetical protein [Flavobacteriaceae bacterium]